MRRLLALAVFLISTFPVIAATHEEKAASAPVPTVDTVYVVIFLVGFIATIVGFCIYFFSGGSEEKKEK
jgi:drug/metabolite transporter (DMT)-like permease